MKLKIAIAGLLSVALNPLLAAEYGDQVSSQNAFTNQSSMEAGLRTALAATSEGDLDLGTQSGGEIQELYADIRPWLHYDFNADWHGYLYAQLFLPTGDVLLDQESTGGNSDVFFGAREFWLEYSGFTAYPGEALRVGKQRIKSNDGLWWDQDVEAIHWYFDTTTLQANLGVAQAFDTYRTDDAELRNDLKDRMFAFASLSGNIAPETRIGVQATFADDQSSDAQQGSFYSDDKLSTGRYVWLGLHLDNGFFDGVTSPDLAYWASVSWLKATQDSVTLNTQKIVTGINTQDTSALAGDAGIRWRLPVNTPINAGIMIAAAQGGNESLYTQTGLQSNRSRYTGTRASFHRFSEALRADFSNLVSTSIFISLPHETWDASLVAHKIERYSTDSGIITGGTSVSPATNSKEIGQGLDLVLSYYNLDAVVPARWANDADSYVRLRASVFNTGDAYAANAQDTLHRVVFEWIMRF
ncbi:MAG: alginate export family protein [Hahellaceae bacterium]|nr:alginate export family protein [Hahellaceae bacterium]MCP5168320.1 alginate export family protein [Hahellaceae bacterium]